MFKLFLLLTNILETKYNKAKACGVVVRASDSQLGDPGSNLGSAKSLSTGLNPIKLLDA